ncbi:hypothetical protein [Brenneria roseae]
MKRTFGWTDLYDANGRPVPISMQLAMT